MLIFITLITVLIICVVFTLSIGVGWLTHLDMCKGDNKKVQYRITFPQFIEAYFKREWRRDEQFPASHFGLYNQGFCGYTDYIHASIVRFSSKTCTFSLLGYIRFLIWEHKNKLKVDKRKLRFRDEV